MDLVEKIYDKTILSDLRAERSPEGSKLLCKVKRSKYVVVVPLKTNESIAYLAGAIAGDGNFALTKRKKVKFPRTSIRIYNASKEYLTELNHMFEENFRVGGIIRPKKDENCFELKIDNKVVWLYFNKITCLPLKKENLIVPRAFENKALFKFFVAGLFDTDGFKSQETFGIMLNSRNKKFLERISELAREFYGIEFGKIGVNELHANNKVYGRVTMRLKRAFCELFISTIPLIHDRYAMGLRRIELRVFAV